MMLRFAKTARGATAMLSLVSMLSCASSAHAPAAPAAAADAYVARMERRLAALPEDAGIRYCLCAAYDDAGRIADALACLEGLDRRGWPVSMHPRDFRKSRDAQGFAALAQRSEERLPRVSRSQLSFTAPADLVPENVAFDPKSGAFFLGSVPLKKIVRVSGGHVQDFGPKSITPPLVSVVGMKVDPARRTLWAATEDHHGAASGPSELLLFDVDSGELLRRFATADGRPHLFNDVVVSSKEDVFVTDSVGGGIYRVSARGALESFLPAGTFEYPNGIAFSSDEKKLFVAFDVGIAAVDIATRTVTELRNDTPLSTAGIDGLYMHRDALVAVQNGIGRGRVVRFMLDAEGQRVTHAELLESGNPDFHRPSAAVPTTGVLVGDRLHYIANYQSHSRGKETMLDVRVLSIDLPH